MSGFLFLRPWWLLALLLLPVLVIRWRNSPKGDATPWSRVVDPWLLQALLVEGDGNAIRAGRRFFIFFWVVGVLALAGPSWQRLPPLQFQPMAPPLALLVDLSDQVAPPQLERTRALAQRLLTALPQRPVSLWVFGDRAWRVLPASGDLRLLSRLVPVLDPDLLPVRGDDLNRALEKMAEKGRDVLLVTPVIRQGGLEGARALAGRGGRLWVLSDARGDRQPLRALAETGNGGAFDGSGLPELIQALEPEAFRASQQGQAVPIDGGPWLALLLLPGLWWRFRHGGVLALAILFLPVPLAEAGLEGWFLNPDQQAWKALRKGDAERAETLFQDPLWRGIAAYRAGNLEAAADHFSRVESALGQYNLGNARVRLGDLEGAREAYRRALELDPDFTDARYNLELVEAALAESGDSALPPMDLRPRQGKPGKAQGESGHAPLPSPSAPPPSTPKPSSKGAGQVLPEGGEGAAEEKETDSGGTEAVAKRPPGKGGAEGRRQPAPPRQPGAGQGEPRRAQSPGDAVAQKAEPVERGEKRQAREKSPAELAQGKSEAPLEAKGNESSSPSPAPDAATEAGTMAGEVSRATEVQLELIRDDPAELLRALFRQQLEERR